MKDRGKESKDRENQPVFRFFQRRRNRHIPVACAHAQCGKRSARRNEASGKIAAMRRKETRKDKARGLLGELAAFSERLFSGGFETQCGALCHRTNPQTGALEVLLVTSRDSGRWIIPKGWPVEGKTLHRSAEIEAHEEAGVRGKARKKPLGYFTYLKAKDDGSLAPCTVEVHLVETRSVDTSFREKGQRHIEWVSCTEAARRVREPELKGLFPIAERKLRKG